MLRVQQTFRPLPTQAVQVPLDAHGVVRDDVLMRNENACLASSSESLTVPQPLLLWACNALLCLEANSTSRLSINIHGITSASLLKVKRRKSRKQPTVEQAKQKLPIQ